MADNSTNSPAAATTTPSSIYKTPKSSSTGTSGCNKDPTLSRTPLSRGPFPRSSSKRLNAAFKSPFRSPTSSKVDPKDDESQKKEFDKLKQQEEIIDREIQQLEMEGFHEDELGDHIKYLHEYNEWKDIGQMLLGRIAVHRGVTSKDLYGEYGLELED